MAKVAPRKLGATFAMLCYPGRQTRYRFRNRLRHVADGLLAYHGPISAHLNAL